MTVLSRAAAVPRPCRREAAQLEHLGDGDDAEGDAEGVLHTVPGATVGCMPLRPRCAAKRGALSKTLTSGGVSTQWRIGPHRSVLRLRRSVACQLQPGFSAAACSARRAAVRHHGAHERRHRLEADCACSARRRQRRGQEHVAGEPVAACFTERHAAPAGIRGPGRRWRDCTGAPDVRRPRGAPANIRTQVTYFSRRGGALALLHSGQFPCASLIAAPLPATI